MNEHNFGIVAIWIAIIAIFIFTMSAIHSQWEAMRSITKIQESFFNIMEMQEDRLDKLEDLLLERSY